MIGGDEAHVLHLDRASTAWAPGAGAGELVAAGLAVTGADGTADDGAEPGLDDPQPASATSARRAATVTEKRWFIS